MLITYRYRVKDSNHKNWFDKKVRAINFVWNYCNEVSYKAWTRDRKWINWYQLCILTAGSSIELGLGAQIIQQICKQHSQSRSQFKKCKLKWRGKKSLGWIPLTNQNFTFRGNLINFSKRKFKIWKDRDISGKIKSGCFSEDSKGNWFINIVCEVPEQKGSGVGIIGIDLGLKTLATCSDGKIIENPKVFAGYEKKLAKAQRANKKKQVTNLSAKVKNVRKDYLHKVTTSLVDQNNKIFVGNVNSARLAKTKMAKAVLDASWGLFRSMLIYKASGLGVDCKIIDEKYSTVTCSTCLRRTGPSGLGALGVRSWVCESCKTEHNRDVNAAINILNFGLGHETP